MWDDWGFCCLLWFVTCYYDQCSWCFPRCVLDKYAACISIMLPATVITNSWSLSSLSSPFLQLWGSKVTDLITIIVFLIEKTCTKKFTLSFLLKRVLEEYLCTFIRKEPFVSVPKFTYHIPWKRRMSLNNVTYNTTLLISTNALCQPLLFKLSLLRGQVTQCIPHRGRSCFMLGYVPEKCCTNQNTVYWTQSCHLKQCIIWGLGDWPSLPI